MFVLYFLLWTLILYWVHRVSHKISVIRVIHLSHHKFILTHKTKWHWSNIFLFNDNIDSTIDLWLTEVIPTILFCIVTGQWWISIFYYVWAAFIQESIEHKSDFNVPILTSGKWHMLHHRERVNYGLFTPIWDIVFGTYKHAH